MSNPYLIGSSNAAAGIGTTLGIGVATATALGDAIIVAANSNSPSVTGVSDSKGNSYRQIALDTNQVNLPTFAYVADGTNNTGGPAALTTLDTIIVTYGSTAGSKAAGAVGVTGIVASEIDQVPTPTDNLASTAPSITSGALAQASEACIAIEANASGGGAITWGAGWNSLVAQHPTSASYLNMAYQVSAATSPVTASGTIVSVKWAMILVTVKLALAVTTASLPIAKDGISYSQTLGAIGGNGGYTWAVTSGALPPWAALNPATGIISGNPSGGGTASFTVQVTDASGGVASAPLTITTKLTPYVAGSASAASGGSTNLLVPITKATNSGDSVLVAAISKTAGVTVTGVTDTAGNTYSLAASDTTEPAAQLFIFESDGSSPIPVGGSGGGTGTPGPVGSTINTPPFPPGTTQDVAMADWNSVTGTVDQCMKVYFTTVGQFPTTVTEAIQGCIDKGIPAVLCYKPSYNPPLASETAAMVNSINAFKAAGLTNGYVVLWQEVEGSPLTAAQYHAVMQMHYAGLSATGFKVYYDAAGWHQADWASYYPGKNFVDGVAVDYYADGYASGKRIDSLMAIADNDGLPFGVFELGITATGKNIPNQATFQNYLSYVQNLMTGRLAAGKVNGPVMWYNATHGPGVNGVIVPLGVSSVSYAGLIAQTLWPAFYTALTTVPVATAPITVTYSANTTAQAALAVSVTDVGSRDQLVTAHGSSTAPSVTSGALAQAAEQAVAFAAVGSAGSNPAWAAPFSQITNVDSFLSVAQDVVNSVAALTASATITSTAQWAAAIVTFAEPAAVVTTPLTGGIVGQPYSQTLEASGGTPPYTWSITGTLPPGLSLTAGVVSGTPTTAGSYPLTENVTDANGVVGSLSVTVNIIAPSISAAPRLALPDNLLPAADSGFEVPGFTWVRNVNATGIAISVIASLEGAQSLSWTSAGDGATSIHSGSHPVTPNMGYIASGYILCPSPQNVAVGIRWLDSLGAQIRIDSGPFNPVTANQWQPCQGNFSSPANAASAQMVAFAQGSSAGDVMGLDLAFMGQAKAQVLIDWSNATFAGSGAAGQSFMDVSPWVRMDTGITISHGRRDAISEMQPGTATFELQNDLGQFTRENSASLVAAAGGTVTVGRRCQINVTDESGGWYTRHDGPLSQIDYTFDPTGNTSVASVSVTDVLAFLNRQDAMFCWTKEQVLTNGPILHWSLDDTGSVGGSGVAAETSGTNGPPMRLVNSDSTNVAAITWQDSSSGVETLADAVSAAAPDGSTFWGAGQTVPTTPLRGLASGGTGPYTTPIGSVLLTPAQTAQAAQNTFVGGKGYMLEAALPSPVAPTAAGSDYSFEIWFTMDPAVAAGLSANNGPYIAFGLGNSRTYTNLLAGLFLNSGTLKAECAAYNQPPAFKGLNWPGVPAPAVTASTSATMTADKVKVPHHLVVTMQGAPSAATVSFWLDANLIGSFTLPAGQIYDTITVGGAYGGCGAWYGNLSLMSVYPYILTQQQITLDCQLGQYGMWESSTDDCIAQLGEYAGLPGFWSSVAGQHYGLSLTDYYDIGGSNALSAMQVYEQAEMGLLFVDATGALNFHTRDWRMGYGPPDLYLPAGAFSADLQYELVDQFMTNEAYVAGPNTLGARSTTLISSAAGQTSTQTTTQSLISGGFVNTASQQQYGVYAQNPVGSPVSLPLITWSRGAAALGLPSFSYWSDPNLYDHGAWHANSRSDPWLLPATLTVDLLTLDTAGTGLTISQLYALEIDNMVAPSGILPASFPNGTASVEWFIEGIGETIARSSRTLQFYTSPAEAQRAWVPGDGTYGVLGATTRIGVSAPDTSTPQADGKDVSHDAGPPYWPPTFDANMNNPDGQGSAFVGANEMRGLTQNLQTMLAPPMCVVSASSQTQSMNNGSQAAPQLFWDVVHVDTAAGMGLIPGWPNWYVVTVPGFYEIDACVTWSLTGGGLGGYTGQSWIVVALGAAQALAAGTATPLTVNQYICPAGEATRFNSSSVTPVNAPTARMYLGLGDMVAIAAEQNYTSSRGTSTTGAGSMMSIRFTGLGKVDDRTEINSSIASGGTVSLVTHGITRQSVFTNSATYSYQGDKGFAPNARRNTNGNCYQGLKGTFDSEGSQVSQIAFSTASIISALSGKTILSASLTCTNVITWYSTGCKMMLGTTTKTPGSTSFDPSASGSTPNIMHQSFQQGQALTFPIPVSIVQAFISHGAKALILGDSSTTNLNYYGYFSGGAGAWTLTVNYR